MKQCIYNLITATGFHMTFLGKLIPELPPSLPWKGRVFSVIKPGLIVDFVRSP
jgi:hypothetical protein